MKAEGYDFISKRKIWFLISFCIIGLGVLSLVFQGLNLGIDFVGGNKFTIQFKEHTSSAEIREVLSDYNLEGSTIQESENNTFIVRTQHITQENVSRLMDSFNNEIGEMTVLENELVGPVIGEELQRTAIISLLVAALFIIIYITVRFQFTYAVAAIVALLHDVMITLSIFSFLQMEINTAFVAATLTIMGYSINDTIVVFDRIRENMDHRKKETIAETVNKSIRQILTRSINTSLTSVLALTALFIFGGETTQVFALAMIIGFISGTYSSIFIASPLWFLLNNIFPRFRKQPQKAHT